MGFIALAYRSCHLLGYNRRLNDGCNDLDLSLESELNRRCFWACWISTCVSMEPESCIRAAWKEVAMVPLPAYIQDCGAGQEIILREKMNQDWEPRPLELNMRHHSTSAAAFLVKIMGVWYETLVCNLPLALLLMFWIYQGKGSTSG